MDHSDNPCSRWNDVPDISRNENGVFQNNFGNFHGNEKFNIGVIVWSTKDLPMKNVKRQKIRI